MFDFLEDTLNELLPNPVHIGLGVVIAGTLHTAFNVSKVIPQAANNTQTGTNLANSPNTPGIPNTPGTPGTPGVKPVGSSGNSFFDSISQSAVESGKKHGIPPSVIMAQAALESGWGNSSLTKNYNNLFGIKGTGPAGSANMLTGEVFGGQSVTIRSNFRTYNNLSESINDHGKFLNENSRYQGALDAYKINKDADEFARKIWEAGYATDPNYAGKLSDLISRHNLKKFD